MTCIFTRRPPIRKMKTELLVGADSLWNSQRSNDEDNPEYKDHGNFKEILDPTPIKSGGRIENNLRSYLLARDEPS